MTRRTIPAAFVAATLAATTLLAAPEEGELFPSFEAPDLLGRTQRPDDWISDEKTLVVTVTDRDAAWPAAAWVKAAQTELPDADPQVVASVSLPFFLPTSFVRTQVKEYVRERYWDDILIDRSGRIAKKLGLTADTSPTVFALDEQGRVIATFHGPVDAPGARAFWKRARKG